MPVIVNASILSADDVRVAANEHYIAATAPHAEYSFFSDMNRGNRQFGSPVPGDSLDLSQYAIVLFAKSKSAMQEALRRRAFQFRVKSTLSLLRGNYDSSSFKAVQDMKEQRIRAQKKASRGNSGGGMTAGGILKEALLTFNLMNTVKIGVKNIWQESRINVVKTGGYYLLLTQQDKLGSTIGENWQKGGANKMLFTSTEIASLINRSRDGN